MLAVAAGATVMRKASRVWDAAAVDFRHGRAVNDQVSQVAKKVGMTRITLKTGLTVCRVLDFIMAANILTLPPAGPHGAHIYRNHIPIWDPYIKSQ